MRLKKYLSKGDEMMKIEGLFNPERRSLAIEYNKEKRKLSLFGLFLEFIFWLFILGFSLEKIGYNYLNKLGLPMN